MKINYQKLSLLANPIYERKNMSIFAGYFLVDEALCRHKSHAILPSTLLEEYNYFDSIYFEAEA